jgi:uncharacterized protein YjiS (DUF1127 family)
MLTLVHSQPTATHVPVRKATPFSSVLDTIAAWHSRNQARGALSRLDDRLLADIGLTREKQFLECAKPFWQA